jgi:hypothetical protein
MRPCVLPCLQVAGEAQSFLDHIRLGIEAAARDPAALLLFSGGQTRKAAGPRSEGLSYWLVAEAADWFGHPDVRGRAYTEVRLLPLCGGLLLSSTEQPLLLSSFCYMGQVLTTFLQSLGEHYCSSLPGCASCCACVVLVEDICTFRSSKPVVAPTDCSYLPGSTHKSESVTLSLFSCCAGACARQL